MHELSYKGNVFICKPLCVMHPSSRAILVTGALSSGFMWLVAMLVRMRGQ